MSKEQTYEQLNDQVDVINNKINKYRTLHEESSKRMDAIIKKAKEDYNVDSIDELRELLKTLQAKEADEINSVKEKIEHATPIIEEIENGLKELDV